jgi:pilus assembly protein FimV
MHKLGIQGRGIRRHALQALLLALALAIALPALALGLGRIVVKSAPGQPLLAEIPVVAADPSELSNLQVRLASPETFRRVGLPAPDAATANLQFTVALDAGGRPVIRVTSAAPLRQPLLTFLIEVDWGAGRLVREYSVLLEAPTSMAAPAQPIQAPTVGAPNTIDREPQPVAPAPAPAPSTVPTAPAAAPTEAVPDADVVSEPLPESPPVPRPSPAQPAPVPGSLPAPEPGSARSGPAAVEFAAHTVRAGETLSGIASGLDRGGRSLDQMMLALLQANPEAFIGGNINLVREGAVLRAPSQDALERYSRGEAAALVRQQVAQWRQAAAARMPSSAAVADGAAPSTATTDSGRRARDARTEEARLQIVPAASGKGAGTQSGTQAGGEGTMLRQQIQETRETVAARDAEVGELKTRVAELEKIRQQQQQLIAMKDSALAEARANLAKAQQQSTQPQPAAKNAAGEPVLWPWLALALLLVAAGAGWWWWRRRGEARPRIFELPRAPRPSPAGLHPAAAPAGKPAMPSFAAATAPPAPATAAAPPAAPAAAAPGPATVEPPAPVGSPAAPTAAPPAPASAAAPTTPAAPAAPAATAFVTPPAAPHWTSAPALVGAAPPAAPRVLLPEEQVPPARQVELARAYLDLGDDVAARALLQEALNGRDPVAREIATRMLRELG